MSSSKSKKSTEELIKQLSNHINLAVIGHVDSGKSTTCGAILYLSNCLTDHELNKLGEEAEKFGRGSFRLAFATDSTQEEKRRGITIDLAHKEFLTKNRHFTIVDCPGHRDFIKTAIKGVAQAESALLMISAADGIEPQTLEHLVLTRTSNVTHLVCAINKMDMVFDRLKRKGY